MQLLIVTSVPMFIKHSTEPYDINTDMPTCTSPLSRLQFHAQVPVQQFNAQPSHTVLTVVVTSIVPGIFNGGKRGPISAKWNQFGKHSIEVLVYFVCQSATTSLAHFKSTVQSIKSNLRSHPTTLLCHALYYIKVSLHGAPLEVTLSFTTTSEKNLKSLPVPLGLNQGSSKKNGPAHGTIQNQP